MRRQLQIGGVSVVIQLVQKLLAVQPECAVEALEASSAADGAVAVVAGRDEEVHLLRADYPLISEMAAADHALLAQLHQIPEEDTDLLFRAQMFPGGRGEGADAVGNEFAVEFPVGQRLLVLSRVAEHSAAAFRMVAAGKIRD